MLLLDELLQYYDWESECVDRIQIVMPDKDWNTADEVNINSDLLAPFYSWIVMDLRCEMSFIEDRPVLRVLIEPL